MVPFESLGVVSYSFSIVTMRYINLRLTYLLTYSILHRLRDKARYWAKIVIFSYPLAFDTPDRGPRRNIAVPFGVDKLE